MSDSSRGRTLLEGLSHILGRVPASLSGQVTVERARTSLEEACKEMLERGTVKVHTQFGVTSTQPS